MTTKDNILNTLKSNKLKLAKFGIRNVGLFGSYIRNEQSSESDIDLLIDFEPEKENFDNYMAVYDLFEKLFKNEKIGCSSSDQIFLRVLPIRKSKYSLWLRLRNIF